MGCVPDPTKEARSELGNGPPVLVKRIPWDSGWYSTQLAPLPRTYYYAEQLVLVIRLLIFIHYLDQLK